MDQLLQTLPNARGASADTSGRVGVIGGSVGFPGQPTLASLAALRSGADAAKALVTEEIYTAVASHSPNVMAEPFEGERYGERTTSDAGSPVLSVVGTGDTMAGVIAALLVQGLDRRDAAELGAWIVGKAGEVATIERGNGVMATDVIDEIPGTIR